MNKIGLIATRTVTTFTQDKPINGGEWVNRVVDLRSYQVYLNKAYTDGGTAILLSCDESGCYIAQMRPLLGQEGANTTIWLYVPNTIQVSGSELSAILKQIELEQEKEKIDPMVLGSLVSSEYPDCTDEVEYQKSAGNDKIAVRYYGVGTDFTLSNLLNDLYQPEYTQYKFVFVLGNGVRIAEDKLTEIINLTDSSIKQLVTVTPTFDHGFVPYANGVPMEGPITMYAGEELVVTWQREGYREVCLRYHVNHSIVLPPPAEDMRYVAICRENFTVIDELGNTIEDAEVTIKGMLLSPGKTAYVLEKEMGELSVSASASGFVSKQQIVDIRTSEAVIALKHELGGRMPKRKKENKENNGKSLKGWQLIMIIILSVIALVCAGVYFLSPGAPENEEPSELLDVIDSLAILEEPDSSALDFVEEMPNDSLENSDDTIADPVFAEEAPIVTPEPTPEAPAPKKEPTQITAKNLSDAYDYLNGHMAWIKEDLESNPATEGLFDALNTADLSKINQILNKPELIKSGRVNSLLQVVNSARPGRTDTYTKKESDHKITIVDAYLNWLKNVQ